MSELPAYNPDAKCPKCGHDDIGTVHMPRRECDEVEHTEREHLDRICARCHYCWPEAVLPKVKQQQEMAL